MEHPGQTLTRDQLVERLLGMQDAAVDDNTLSVYIRRLREKLEDTPSHPQYIVTVRGVGYRYEEPA
jgi:DNA-binding response OmpR family regulator